MKRRIMIMICAMMFWSFCIGSGCVYAQEKDENIAYNENQLKKFVYDAMLLRKDKVVINYKKDDAAEIFEKFQTKDESKNFLKEISQIDDPATSDDFDYMEHNLNSMKTVVKTGESGAVFTITMVWRESYEQLQYVNQRVSQILDELDLDEVTKYEKTKKIHDYMVKNIEYDTTLDKATAYDALKDGEATCQGYSLLYYKMLTEAGVKARYITGIGDNEDSSGPHGWNIVKVGKKWYNVDVTWDDPIYTNAPKNLKKEISYEFFLKGAAEFDETHKKDDIFLTDEFREKYDISDTNFDKENYIEEFDEEVETPLIWELGPENGEEMEHTGVQVGLDIMTSIGEWFVDVMNGKINPFSDLGKKWTKLPMIIKVLIVLFVLLLILNKINKIRQRKKQKQSRNYYDYDNRY